MRRFSMLRRQVLSLGSLAAAALLSLGPVHAQDAFPNKPIRMLVGFAAGGPTDMAARAVAEALSKQLGQTVVVDNKPGGNAMVAVQELLNSRPDGYTLLLATSGNLTLAPALYKKVPYDVKKDFTFLAPVVGYASVLVVPAQSKAKDLPTLIKMAKSGEMKLSVGSVGNGNELMWAWFENALGVKILRINYKGNSAVINDLLGRRVGMAILAPGVAMPLVESGKLIAMGLTAESSVEMVKKIPTLKASGLPVENRTWNALVGPAGMAPDVAQKLQAAIRDVMKSPEVAKRLAQTGQQPLHDSNAEFVARMDQDIAHWKRVVEVNHFPLIE